MYHDDPTISRHDDAWGDRAFTLEEAERIERDIDRAESVRLASRPHRVIHELPRKDSVNGYVFVT